MSSSVKATAWRQAWNFLIRTLLGYLETASHVKCGKMILVLTILLHPIYHGFESFKLLQFFWESKFRTCFRKLISSRRFLLWWWLLVEVFIDTFKKCTRSTVIMSIVQMITTNEQFFRKSVYLENFDLVWIELKSSADVSTFFTVKIRGYHLSSHY